MQDRYLFRGKDKRSGQWIYGHYWSNGIGNHFIRVAVEKRNFTVVDYEVDSKTVGQCTGLKDKSGRFIFEGDIFWDCYEEEYGVVKWSNDDVSFILIIENISYALGDYMSDDLDVVGNIHDNPELLYD